MIIIKLTGGIGNQLFQYALGRSLSIKNGDSLFLDISEYHNKEQYRKYFLSFFKIEAKESDSPIDKVSVVKEKEEFIYDQSIFNHKGNILLQGYWQNEKYFSDIRQVLLKDITLKDEYQTDVIKKINNAILNDSTVAVHVRRGDYIKNKMINKIYGVCDKNYYLSAISKMAEIVKSPTFLFFSDDIKWVKKNIKTGFPSFYISGNKDYEDLVIMQNCKNNIISNSSFSWWAAWLNPNTDKKIIAPRIWINNDNYNYSNLIPENWIKIDNFPNELSLGKKFIIWTKKLLKK